MILIVSRGSWIAVNKFKRDKLNKLEIKYFNNIELRIQEDTRLIANGGFKYLYEIADPTLNDFYEFHVDEKPLIQHLLGEHIWKGYLENFNGLLGTRKKLYDELLVRSLLNKEIEIKTVKAHYLAHEIEISDEIARSIIYELGLKRPLVYGCKICGDFDCGGISIDVQSDSKGYSWFTYNEASNDYDQKLFSFEKSEYEEVFGLYLDNWKKAKTGTVDTHRIS